MRFQCKECNFRFESREKPKMCPFCSKNSVRKEPDIGEILDEIESELKE